MLTPTEDDWEAGHLARVGGEGIPLPGAAVGLHHDDAIVSAIATTKTTAPVGQNGSHTPTASSAVGEVSNKSFALVFISFLFPAGLIAGQFESEESMAIFSQTGLKQQINMSK